MLDRYPWFVVILLVAGFFTLPARDVGAAPVADKPNILMIVIDDLGWMDLGCQGSRFYQTPHVDRLAAEGMRFTDAYASASICSPTRAALMTGQSPARLHLTAHIPGRASGEHFVPNNADLLPAESIEHLPHAPVTLAEALHSAGYVTGFIGKWHLAGTKWTRNNGLGDEAFHPQHHGFDVNLGGCARGMPGSYFEPYGIPTLEPRRRGEYLPDRLADETIRLMRGARGRPFFLALWHYTVHTPIQAPDDLVKKYLPLKEQGLKNPTYAAMVEAMDRQVGRVLQALDSLGLADNTLVIFTSDNGGLSRVTDNAPLRAGKGHLYEGGVRVPLIVRWPGRVRGGSTEAAPVISHDLYPTLLEAAGVDPPAGQPLDGESLMPLFDGRGKLERQAIHFHYPNYSNDGNRLAGAVRRGPWKLIEFFDDDSVELYNLVDDIGERRDLAGQHPDKAAALRKDLRAWRQDVDALMPRPR